MGDLQLSSIESRSHSANKENGGATDKGWNQCHCNCPGAFSSDMNRAARDHAEFVAKAIPSKRIGNEEDMAAAAIYLAARAGDYVVGETLVVDGGLVHADPPGGWGPAA